MSRATSGRSSKKSKKKSRLGLIDTILLFIFAAFAINFGIQLLKKPAEALNLLGLGQVKSISQTWQAYGDAFAANSTAVMSPAFLAAMAQVESSGNPFATPEWRFKLGSHWDRIFSPLSSSVGLYQFTDGTYDQAKNYCVHAGVVYQDGPWHDINSCWFNWAYLRIWPAHSIEMTSAYLQNSVDKILRERRVKASLQAKKRLAAIVHLCGPEKGARFARVGFNLARMGKCGDHFVMNYVRKIENYERRFEQMAYVSSSGRLTSEHSY